MCTTKSNKSFLSHFTGFVLTSLSTGLSDGAWHYGQIFPCTSLAVMPSSLRRTDLCVRPGEVHTTQQKCHCEQSTALPPTEFLSLTILLTPTTALSHFLGARKPQCPAGISLVLATVTSSISVADYSQSQICTAKIIASPGDTLGSADCSPVHCQGLEPHPKHTTRGQRPPHSSEPSACHGATTIILEEELLLTWGCCAFPPKRLSHQVSGTQNWVMVNFSFSGNRKGCNRAGALH